MPEKQEMDGNFNDLAVDIVVHQRISAIKKPQRSQLANFLSSSMLAPHLPNSGNGLVYTPPLRLVVYRHQALRDVWMLNSAKSTRPFPLVGYLVPALPVALTLAAVSADSHDPHVSTQALTHSGQEHWYSRFSFLHFLGVFTLISWSYNHWKIVGCGLLLALSGCLATQFS
jgi:hypothetical protein